MIYPGHASTVVATAGLILFFLLPALTGCGGGGGGDAGPAPDITAPTVISTTPLSDARAAQLNTDISVVFSEAMDGASLSNTSFILSSNGKAVAGTVSTKDDTATFKPAANLVGGTTYTASISTAAKDLAGNTLAADHSWSFTTPFPRFAYAVNGGDKTISMYTVDSALGRLRHNGYALTQNGPRSVTVDPYGRFAYVVNAGSGTISHYLVDAVNGRLVTGDVVTANSAFAMTIHPSGRFAYVANSNGTVRAYRIDQTSGALSPGDSIPAGTSPYALSIDPRGKQLAGHPPSP